MAVVGISAGKVLGPRRISLEPGESNTTFMVREHGFPAHFAKFFLGSGFSLVADASAF